MPIKNIELLKEICGGALTKLLTEEQMETFRSRVSRNERNNGAWAFSEEANNCIYCAANESRGLDEKKVNLAYAIASLAYEYHLVSETEELIKKYEKVDVYVTDVWGNIQWNSFHKVSDDELLDVNNNRRYPIAGSREAIAHGRNKKEFSGVYRYFLSEKDALEWKIRSITALINAQVGAPHPDYEQSLQTFTNALGKLGAGKDSGVLRGKPKESMPAVSISGMKVQTGATLTNAVSAATLRVPTERVSFAPENISRVYDNRRGWTDGDNSVLAYVRGVEIEHRRQYAGGYWRVIDRNGIEVDVTLDDVGEPIEVLWPF